MVERARNRHPEPSEMPDRDYWGASIRLKPERIRTRLNYTSIFCIAAIVVWVVAAIIQASQ